MAKCLESAAAGSVALRAAVLRKLLIELDIQDDLHWVLVLWYLSKFYDTIKIAALITQALARKLPPALLSMLVSTYQAPRALRQRGAVSEWTSPAMSVLA